MLKKINRQFYKVKAGQTLKAVAEYFSVSPYLLARENGLTAELFEGQILQIPKETGNAYTVQAGDSEELLCGKKENYLKKNGAQVFYPGMRGRV
ncbi:MAG: LysM peptidoglycan-binding domain-containing protein [Clostridia bacterium]|nr:LysM peptidoglycan-binding domain-containing protein [Clostridia bacterium]